MRKVVSKAVTAGGRFDFFLDSGEIMANSRVKLLEESQYSIHNIWYTNKSQFTRLNACKHF